MLKVYRCFTEKRPGFDIVAGQLLAQLKHEEGIGGLEAVRVLYRYDTQGIDDQVYTLAKAGVFSEPACDTVYDEHFDIPEGWRVLAVEALPGQFDMRADSCQQCIAMMTGGERPAVRAATHYLFSGAISEADMDIVRRVLINPIESRVARMDKPTDLAEHYSAPDDVAVLTGLTAPGADLAGYITEYGLAMDMGDLACLRDYFASEGRDPSVTELKMIDTYWSDHCRHTTFLTELVEPQLAYAPAQASFEEYLAARRELYGDKAESRPVTLMDIATCGAKILKKRGILQNLDESEEINACSVRVNVDVDGEMQPWLLMFKNETHNHPTEIEPFGGAATCLGGAIRDPLSGRAYVYQAMRVTGAADPRTPLSETLPGKLPQRTICRKAAAGYSAYGNQIGLATGLVSEVYHPGYVAKRLETGAVVGAAPAEHVRREAPAPGDVVVLLGGRTGRDGCGGATGSSKSHSSDSLEECGAEVQKGNAPEERKIQRLFRNGAATRLIKRCNDFGAGGVSVAVGELADGLDIDLDIVPKKYDGLDGTELAIAESQERMAVVLSAEDLAAFEAHALAENLETTVIATVTAEPRLKMRWRGKVICDISRAFLDSNGAKKTARAAVPALNLPETALAEGEGDTRARAMAVLSNLNVAIQKGLGSRFDGTVGANTVLMPFGGKNQLTPIQAMAAKLPVHDAETSTASVMAWGFDPVYMAQNPYLGAQAACLSSVAKLAASGCSLDNAYFSFQEFFEKPGKGDPTRLGKPLAALLGAFTAQTALGIAAIGGKDSMSGTFNDIDVPPTLISFAIATLSAGKVLSPEFKRAGCPVWYFPAPYVDGAPDIAGARAMYNRFHALCERGAVEAAWAVSAGGIVEAVAKMAVGDDIGFALDSAFPEDALFKLNYGGIVAQMKSGETPDFGVQLGETITAPELKLGSATLSLDGVKAALLGTLEDIYPASFVTAHPEAPTLSFTERTSRAPAIKSRKPLAILPAFPGTNCEWDTQRAIDLAGGEGRILLVRNLTPATLQESVDALADALKDAQMIVFPGGFSGGDEPEGSGKFTQALFRSPKLQEAVHDLLYKRDGLALGICNGFQALIKLGLVPFGRIQALDASSPTVTFNEIGRHQSGYTYTRVSSVKSPWLSLVNVGEVYNTAMSHGEGRFMADAETLQRLADNGQIALQYCDAAGNAAMDIGCNPNGSLWAVEGITSPDGRVLGKMGHNERYGAFVAQNIRGEKYMPLFKGGVRYFG